MKAEINMQIQQTGVDEMTRLKEKADRLGDCGLTVDGEVLVDGEPL